MADWEFWKGFGSGIIIVSAAIFSVAKGVAAIKSILPKRPKLKIEVKDCLIEIGRFVPAWHWGEKAQFTLVANNVGSKNCSVTSVKLKLPNEIIIDLKAKSTTLPLIISTDKPEEIRMCGLCRELEKLNDALDDPKRPDMFPKQDSVKTVILININTRTRPIKCLTAFAISRPERKVVLAL